MDDDLVTMVEAGDLLGVHAKSVHRYLRSGLLTPVFKLPGPTGAYLLRRKDVERLARAQAKGVTGATVRR